MLESSDLLVITADITKAAMGDKGGWVGAPDDVIEFIKKVHGTLHQLRFPPSQSR